MLDAPDAPRSCAERIGNLLMAALVALRSTSSRMRARDLARTMGIRIDKALKLGALVGLQKQMRVLTHALIKDQTYETSLAVR
ncbi:hypothetical protein [Deinococcus hopiensis]|uniref:hypothetical protein n=1 Tax=Deinococcus hopiensis TaxID=309885 RepID=UPI0009FEA540|nr:hypothetical protein [Deinococcus hopiensis]